MSSRMLICFDWDGTLADSMDVCVRQIELALQRAGLEPRPMATMRACNGPTYEQSVGVLGIAPEMGPTFLRLRAEAEMEILAEYQKLFPGVSAMLERLETIADLAIVSNGLPDYLTTSMHLTGVESRFRYLEPLREGRTKTEALAELLAKVQPARAVMIGDRLGDLEAGRSNGLTTVAACYGYGHADEWAAADLCADSVEALEKLLTEMVHEGER